LYGTGRNITLAGHVEGGQGPVGLAFSGAASTGGATDAAGGFSIQTTANSLGAVHGTAHDYMHNLSSDVVDVMIESNAPVINDFTAAHDYGLIWTFQGSVEDEQAAGLVVCFGGLTSLQNQTATVDADGKFSLTIE